MISCSFATEYDMEMIFSVAIKSIEICNQLDCLQSLWGSAHFNILPSDFCRVKGKRYFESPPLCGGMVRPDKVKVCSHTRKLGLPELLLHP